MKWKQKTKKKKTKKTQIIIFANYSQRLDEHEFKQFLNEVSSYKYNIHMSLNIQMSIKIIGLRYRTLTKFCYESISALNLIYPTH